MWLLLHNFQLRTRDQASGMLPMPTCWLKQLRCPSHDLKKAPYWLLKKPLANFDCNSIHVLNSDPYANHLDLRLLQLLKELSKSLLVLKNLSSDPLLDQYSHG